MLSLDRGRAIRFVTDQLSERGYTWAYRVLDTRSFGLPQRRQRVFLLASRSEDPREVLFSDDIGSRPVAQPTRPVAAGFSWTENAVPTLRGDSSRGIPSPPAIWIPQQDVVVTPDIQDVERLQGFRSNWTAPAVDDVAKRNGPQWRLVDDAVSVPVAQWLGERLRKPVAYDRVARVLSSKAPWPSAAWGSKSGRRVVDASCWPVGNPPPGLLAFLRHEVRLLSARATLGFLRRAHSGRLRFKSGFLESVARHARRMEADIDEADEVVRERLFLPSRV